MDERSQERDRGLLVSILNNRATRTGNQRLEALRADLAERRAESDAWLAYKYEARKRLYKDLGPLLFQLNEQSELAFWRICGLARSTRQGRLAPNNSAPKEPTTPPTASKSRLRADSNSYLPSTVYRFMAPLVSLRLCQRQLTSLDLSLDRDVETQYRLAKMLYKTWSEGQEIAECEPRLDYDPERQDLSSDSVPARTEQQHLSFQKLERAIQAMIVTPNSGDRAERCIELGEFLDEYVNTKSPLPHDNTELSLAEKIRPITRLFVDFTPEERPVLWRLLIVQAHLFAVLSGRSEIDRESGQLPALSEEDREKLEWRQPADAKDNPAVTEEPFAAANRYCQRDLPPTQRQIRAEDRP